MNDLQKAIANMPKPYHDDGKGHVIYCGDCRELLPMLSGYDSVVTDPPYAEVNRDYGRMTETEWHGMMRNVVESIRNGLSVNGSAVFILQPNSERVGRMRPWLWEFMAWTAREWNQVQDAWWWNSTCPPTIHCNAKIGLMRPSVKACVWLGDSNCYRDQTVVLLPISDATKRAVSRNDMELRYSPSGINVRNGRMANTAIMRGGSTPYNMLVCSNANSSNSAGAKGHGAGTPMKVADWWIRYITPDGGSVVDPFCGSGTMVEAAQKQGLRCVGIEKEERYCEIAARRLDQEVLF